MRARRAESLDVLPFVRWVRLGRLPYGVSDASPRSFQDLERRVEYWRRQYALQETLVSPVPPKSEESDS